MKTTKLLIKPHNSAHPSQVKLIKEKRVKGTPRFLIEERSGKKKWIDRTKYLIYKILDWKEAPKKWQDILTLNPNIKKDVCVVELFYTNPPATSLIHKKTLSLIQQVTVYKEFQELKLWDNEEEIQPGKEFCEPIESYVECGPIEIILNNSF